MSTRQAPSPIEKERKKCRKRLNPERNERNKSCCQREDAPFERENKRGAPTGVTRGVGGAEVAVEEQEEEISCLSIGHNLNCIKICWGYFPIGFSVCLSVCARARVCVCVCVSVSGSLN